eukprot:31178-Pelagococcus_subviridis.AAC.10
MVFAAVVTALIASSAAAAAFAACAARDVNSSASAARCSASAAFRSVTPGVILAKIFSPPSHRRPSMRSSKVVSAHAPLRRLSPKRSIPRAADGSLDNPFAVDVAAAAASVAAAWSFAMSCRMSFKTASRKFFAAVVFAPPIPNPAASSFA